MTQFNKAQKNAILNYKQAMGKAIDVLHLIEMQDGYKGKMERDALRIAKKEYMQCTIEVNRLVRELPEHKCKPAALREWSRMVWKVKHFC